LEIAASSCPPRLGRGVEPRRCPNHLKLAAAAAAAAAVAVDSLNSTLPANRAGNAGIGAAREFSNAEQLNQEVCAAIEDDNAASNLGSSSALPSGTGTRFVSIS
jgi:hypothetical protein